MKRYTRYIIATFAAIASLVSCAKEPALVPEDSGLLPEGQMREIAVSFGASTKTTLNADGKTPKFLADDVIKVSNATLSEDCTVKSIGGSLKIITRLSGTLTAVYPSTAANMSGNGNAPIKASPELPYKVSSTQSGLFKDANICTATISEGATSATFNNVTPLLKFYVDASIGVQSLTITSTVDIASDGGGKTITVAPAGGALIHTVTTDNPDPRLCYIAILPNVNANTLTYTSVTTVHGQGTVTNTMTSNVTLEANHIYKAFIPYYIKVQVGTDDYQKWAYCNVGAFLPEEPGLYFAWGETVGRKPATGGTGAFTAKPFTFLNTPYNDGSSDYSDSGSKPFYTKYIDNSHTILELTDDAAYVNWGAKWRMPTYQDAKTLATKSTKTHDSTTGGYFFGTSPNRILFPLTGNGNVDKLEYTEQGRYWTSSINTVYSYPHKAQFFNVNLEPAQIAEQFFARYYGAAVRPIYDPAVGSDFDPYTDEGNI